VKQSLRDRLSDYVYNGFWFSPEGRYVSRCVALAEENVTGKVNMEIYKGNGTLTTFI
jgi:argininosuccinate synthase